LPATVQVAMKTLRIPEPIDHPLQSLVTINSSQS